MRSYTSIAMEIEDIEMDIARLQDEIDSASDLLSEHRRVQNLQDQIDDLNTDKADLEQDLAHFSEQE